MSFYNLKDFFIFSFNKYIIMARPKKHFKTIDEYIGTFPEEIQDI